MKTVMSHDGKLSGCSSQFLVCSVDVGVTHFAYCLRNYDYNFNPCGGVVHAETLNLQQFDFKPQFSLRPGRAKPSRDASTRLRCLAKTHSFLMESSFMIIEQQPLVGMKDVEQVWGAICESRDIQVIIVSPRQMHKFYHIENKNYEERKKWTTAYAEKHLRAMNNFTLVGRKHDMGDAFCLLEFAMYKLKNERAMQRKKFEKSLQQELFIKSKKLNLDQFIFKKKIG